MSIVIVYHAKSLSTICPDGFAAAMVAWRNFGDSAEYLRALYHVQRPLERFIDKDVIFLDFSYGVEYMDQIAKVAKSLVVLDHHMPKAQEFEGRDYAVFSPDASGAILAWKHWFWNEPIPLMLKLIDDGDRFLNTLPDVDAFHASLSIEDESFANWSSLLDLLQPDSFYYTKFMDRGRILVESDDARIQNLVRESFPITLCGIQGLAVNTTKYYAHNTATALAKHSKTFGAAFYVRSDGKVEISLRRIDPDTDVFNIAKTFGGGGHRGAAAFAISLSEFSALLNIPQKLNTRYEFIQAAISSFTPTLSGGLKTTSEYEELFLRHLQRELGSLEADYLKFSLEASTSKCSLLLTIQTLLARLFNLETHVANPKWYHSLFPYSLEPVVNFDDASILKCLLDSNKFQDCASSVEQILETCTVNHVLVLQYRKYYLHLTLVVNGLDIVKHTYEVL